MQLVGAFFEQKRKKRYGLDRGNTEKSTCLAYKNTAKAMNTVAAKHALR